LILCGKDLDSLLIALYVLIDDSRDRFRAAPPGHPEKLSDAELVWLVVAQVLLGARSEHHWLRMCYAPAGYLFPYLPKQPGYHIAQRLLALAAAIWHNWATGTTDLRCLTAYDH
jgi:hypothetical protein